MCIVRWPYFFAKPIKNRMVVLAITARYSSKISLVSSRVSAMKMTAIHINKMVKKIDTYFTTVIIQPTRCNRYFRTCHLKDVVLDQYVMAATDRNKCDYLLNFSFVEAFIVA